MASAAGAGAGATTAAAAAGGEEATSGKWWVTSRDAIAPRRSTKLGPGEKEAPSQTVFQAFTETVNKHGTKTALCWLVQHFHLHTYIHNAHVQTHTHTPPLHPHSSSSPTRTSTTQTTVRRPAHLGSSCCTLLSSVIPARWCQPRPCRRRALADHELARVSVPSSSANEQNRVAHPAHLFCRYYMYRDCGPDVCAL